VGVAQLVERRIVVPVAEGSNPSTHPIHAMDFPNLDRDAFRVDALGDESDEKAYWHSRTPLERLQALELLRQIHYGYDPATSRLQRVFEVAKLSRG
jgi:hypothetical protein